MEATEDGVPQGASLSPLLANVYLHYVLDEWFECEVRTATSRRSVHDTFRRRFSVLLFRVRIGRCERDTKRCCRNAWPVSRLVSRRGENEVDRVRTFCASQSPAIAAKAPRDVRLPRIHPLLRSFSPIRASFKLKRKTSGKKLRIKLTEMRLWFHHQLSTPIGAMWQVLNAKLRGHYQYYGINDNWPMLMAFRSKVRPDG